MDRQGKKVKEKDEDYQSGEFWEFWSMVRHVIPRSLIILQKVNKAKTIICKKFMAIKQVQMAGQTKTEKYLQEPFSGRQVFCFFIYLKKIVNSTNTVIVFYAMSVEMYN